MSSDASASPADRDAALARLSGPELVEHLRTTCRRADYDAAARLLGDRDRRLAHAVAALGEAQADLVDLAAQVRGLKEGYLVLKAAGRGPNMRSSSGGAIAAPAPRADRRTDGAGPEGADVIDLCGDGRDDDEWEDGEFRPDVAGVSSKRKESAAPEGDEVRRAGVSCKRKAPASACSSDDDDNIPLSQLMKKRRGAVSGANGKRKKGHGDVPLNSAGPLRFHRPVISSVNTGGPEANAEQRLTGPEDPKMAVFKQGTGNGRSGKNGGLPRTVPSSPPTGSTVGNSPQKNSSEPDGAEGQARIGGKQGPVARPKNDAPFQVRTPNLMDMPRRIAGLVRVDTQMPLEHCGSLSDGTISIVLNSIEIQEKTIGGGHMTKGSLETNGNGGRASAALRAIREQGNPNGQVLKTKVLPGTNGIGEQWSKLSPCQSREDTDGGRPKTPDKPVLATLQQNNQLALHSEQMLSESSLPSAVTRRWKSSLDVLTSCLGNKELCMQAACALHRQRKFTTQPTEGGRSGRTGLSKFDAHRAAMLSEFLLDGNLQGPLKRTAEDLVKHDSTGHDLLERLVLQCSEQLFCIFSNKDDKYFH